MPAYNAERYIMKSVQSVLAQTFEDFELLVVNDASSDRTGEILAAIVDRRLRVINNSSNRGVVGSLNVAMSEASGHYIARIDADDLCLPTRFSKQKEFLDSHPKTLIVGAEMSVLEHGKIRFSRQPADTDPQILKWMLHVSNPVGHPSMMFRADAVTALGTYLREEFKFAEDFDFSHRVLRLGDISVVPEYLVIYRQHDLNLTRTRRSEMNGATTAVLSGVYATLLGSNCEVEAGLVVEHLMARTPFDDPSALERLGGFLNRLIAGFADASKLNGEQIQKVTRHTGKLWWRMILASLQAGRTKAARYHGSYRWSDQSRPPAYQIARALASGMVPRGARFTLPRRRSALPVGGGSIDLNGVEFRKTSTQADDPPSLYIVVDTEAEFDWSKSFDHSLTGVSSIRQQVRAQTIFDGYGARPIYVVDYAVASQAEGYAPLREIFDRHGCVIGAHLHPWVNPPFEEEISDHNSFGGNLPTDLEERKLRTLVAMIERNFRVSPLFFKAGRYGVGRGTMETLARLGFAVDFSILPLTDLRPRGGPDFRFAEASPYLAATSNILSIPMTRGQIGLLAPVTPRLHGALQSPTAARLHLPGILSRMRLTNTVTLTPEGVSAGEQIHLIESMVARGCRTFTLHYHSPSLAKHTPYVTTEAELNGFLRNIEVVCRHFFAKLGGMPGNPADLVPPSMRQRVWA
jgi:glycosyltransferase involved in cell wall biosynthesis